MFLTLFIISPGQILFAQEISEKINKVDRMKYSTLLRQTIRQPARLPVTNITQPTVQ